MPSARLKVALKAQPLLPFITSFFPCQHVFCMNWDLRCLARLSAEENSYNSLGNSGFVFTDSSVLYASSHLCYFLLWLVTLKGIKMWSATLRPAGRPRLLVSSQEDHFCLPLYIIFILFRFKMHHLKV